MATLRGTRHNMAAAAAAGTTKWLLALAALLAATSGADAATEDDDSLAPTNIILFLFFGLGCGIGVMQILSYLGEPVPYTVVVFIMGAIFSLASSEEATFGESIKDWIGINADILLFVFLPPLIFGESMYLNWYHVKGGLVQSIILAGPGVLVGAALMGMFAKAILPYNWAWNFAMMFGAILSATDPVAVVSLLKSVGASPKLTILIVGESLLNDGSAMVLFTIFFNSVNGRLYTVGSVIGFSFAAALGSVALGVAIGLLTVRWLRTANRPLVETDVTIQIAVTICSAYLTFFLAQNTLELSGVLACCGAGAMLAWLAPPIILNHESMHNVWGMMEWALNTAIFLLAGLIIGHRVLRKVQAVDWIYMVIFYLALMVIRFFTILVLYPFISTIGHRCTPKEAVFMSWAGLRGALGMALALICEDQLPDDIHDETRRLFFYVGGIAALTLLINATTAKTVLVKLGLLTTDSPERALVTAQIKRKLQRRTDRFIQEMAKDFDFNEEDVDLVRMSCTLMNDMTLPDMMRDSEVAILSAAVQNPLAGVDHDAAGNGQSGSFAMRNKSMDSRVARMSNSIMQVRRMSRMMSTTSRAQGGGGSALIHELVHYMRSIFLEIVRVKYWSLIESGKLPRQSFSAQFLLYSVEVGLDEVQIEGGARDWSCIVSELQAPPLNIRMLKTYESLVPKSATQWSTKTLSYLHSRNEKREVYMLSAFVEAHEHAQKKIHTFLGMGGAVDVEDEDDVRNNSGSMSDELPCPEESMVVEESIRAVEAARAWLSGKSASTMAAIKAKQAARVVLAKQAEMVRTMVEEGLLTASQAEIFLEDISHDTQRIERERNRMYSQHARGKEDKDERFSFFSFMGDRSDRASPNKTLQMRKTSSEDTALRTSAISAVTGGSAGAEGTVMA